MAKLNPYYGLCPLVDHKNFIGISKDVERGHVLVTQGKNIAIKYKLSNQKQIQSWRTKDKFTSPVLFDKNEDKYIAVFNQTTLRLWSQDGTENLDKIKKYKFAKPIYTAINIIDTTYIIFENGNIFTLKDALDQRKDLDLTDIIDMNNEKIVDIRYISVENNVYISLIVKTTSTLNCLLVSFPNNFPGTSYLRIEPKRNNLNLAGYTFCLMYHKYLYFLTLWSDGHLYSYLVAGPRNQETQDNSTENFGTVFANIESISCKQDVAMTSLGSDHIAIYGADCNQEGASIIIYNMQFKISQSKQPFKMFSNINKIWCIDNTLLLCSGQHLAVIPFEINSEQLSQLVGSHKIDVEDLDVQHVYTLEKWDIDEENDYKQLIPAKIRENVLHWLNQGLSEMATCDMLIPSYIENSDIEAIENSLDYFKDISEESLVKILIYLIENYLSYDDQGVPKRNNLVEKVLSLPFTNIFLLPHIKTNLIITTTLVLVKYISSLFSSDECLLGLNNVQTHARLIEWGCVILDGNYQKLLLTRDSAVHDTLKEFQHIVQEHLLGLSDLQSAEPVISDFAKKKYVSVNKENTNVNYSV
ncbi:hypothetical protein AMK59_7154, partial [Oryctes borbonicus]